MWRKQIRSGKKDRMIKKKKPRKGSHGKRQWGKVKWWRKDVLHHQWECWHCALPPSLSYLFRREYTQSASIFTDCHAHLCKQSLPEIQPKNICTLSESIRYWSFILAATYTVCTSFFPLKIICAGNSKRMRTDGVQRWSKWFVAWQPAENGTS